MKPDKVLFCVVLFTFFALAVHKTQQLLLLTKEQTNRNVLITGRCFCIVYDWNLKDGESSWTIQHKPWHLCSFDVCRALQWLHNHSPLWR